MRRSRQSLPGYPFERQRFWVERRDHALVPGRSVPTGKNPNIADWFYSPSWKRSPLPVIYGHQRSSERPSCWLVLVDDCGVGTRLAERLGEAGHTVVTVRKGPSFHRTDAQSYAIDPGRRDDYRALIDMLQKSDLAPQAIVHLWSITPMAYPCSSVETFDALQDAGFYSLLFLVQALGTSASTHPLHISVVSNNMQEVTGEPVLHPEKATALGICKVIPQEYPAITCSSIDLIDPDLDARLADTAIDHLIGEVTASPSNVVVAYRGGYRWVQTFEAMPVDVAGAGVAPLRDGGVYLIIGGLGAIGLVLADHLARTLRPHLVLVGRSTLPKRDQWDLWLGTHNTDDSVSRKILKVRALETEGAQVSILAADAANREEMYGVIDRIYEQWGALHGVIYAAGITGEESFHDIQTVDRTACEEQFRAKAWGLYILEEVLREHKLDFCVLFSSLSSILGGLRDSVYSAANNFMDAFARRHSQTHPTPWTSINWDGWQLEGQENLLATRGEALAALTIMPREGVLAFRKALMTHTTGQLVISTGNLQLRLDRWVEQIPSPDAERTAETSSHPRQDMRNDYVEPRTDLERIIAHLWEELLGIEKVGVHDNFYELGGHSLLAVQLMPRLREAVQVDLPLRDFLGGPTVAEVAESIEHFGVTAM